MFPLGRGERRNSSSLTRKSRRTHAWFSWNFYLFVVRALNRYAFLLNWTTPRDVSLPHTVSLYYFGLPRPRSTAGSVYRRFTDTSLKDNPLHGNHYSAWISYRWHEPSPARFTRVAFQDWDRYNFDAVWEINIQIWNRNKSWNVKEVDFSFFLKFY